MRFLTYMLAILLSGWGILLYLGSVHAGDVQQTVQDAGLVSALLEKVSGAVEVYGWRLAAVLVSPLLVFRFVQWHKRICKEVYGRKPHWLLMDVLSFTLVYGLSFLCLFQEYSQLMQVGIASGCIAGANSIIVKAVFRFVPERIGDILSTGMYVDEDTAFSKTVLAAVVGKRGDQRTEPRP